MVEQRLRRDQPREPVAICWLHATNLATSGFVRPSLPTPLIRPARPLRRGSPEFRRLASVIVLRLEFNLEEFLLLSRPRRGPFLAVSLDCLFPSFFRPLPLFPFNSPDVLGPQNHLSLLSLLSSSKLATPPPPFMVTFIPAPIVALIGGGGVASCSAQIQGLARSKLISCLISKVVRDLVHVLMTFLMRRVMSLLMTLMMTFLTTSVASTPGPTSPLARVPLPC